MNSCPIGNADNFEKICTRNRREGQLASGIFGRFGLPRKSIMPTQLGRDYVVSLTIRLPRFSPASNPINAFGVF